MPLFAQSLASQVQLLKPLRWGSAMEAFRLWDYHLRVRDWYVCGAPAHRCSHTSLLGNICQAWLLSGGARQQRKVNVHVLFRHVRLRVELDKGKFEDELEEVNMAANFPSELDGKLAGNNLR